MNVMSKSEVARLKIIADEVDMVLRSRNSITIANGSLTKTLERHLPHLTMGKDIEVIWDTTHPVEPYIMAMYPDQEELHKKSKELFDLLVDADGVKTKTPSKSIPYDKYTEKWCEIQRWQLYIDIRLIDTRSSLSVTSGDQFSAILAHEIGHVMNGDPFELIRTYRETLYQQSKLERMLLSNNFFVRKIALPVFISTLHFRIVLNRPDSVAEELSADGYIPQEFRGAMIDYVTNRLLKTTAGSRLVISKEEDKADHTTAIRYHRGTIALLVKRRDILKRRLDAQYNSPATINPYLKKLVKFCAAGVTGFKPEDATENPIEEASFANAVIKSNERITMEAMALLESVKVTDRDITMLEIDIDNIKTVDDKMWCIQTIYDYIEYIEKEQAKKYKSYKGAALPKELTRDPRIERLWKLRNKVTDIKISDSSQSYGVFVQYPKGYEG